MRRPKALRFTDLEAWKSKEKTIEKEMNSWSDKPRNKPKRSTNVEGRIDIWIDPKAEESQMDYQTNEWFDKNYDYYDDYTTESGNRDEKTAESQDRMGPSMFNVLQASMRL